MDAFGTDILQKFTNETSYEFFCFYNNVVEFDLLHTLAFTMVINILSSDKMSVSLLWSSQFPSERYKPYKKKDYCLLEM